MNNEKPHDEKKVTAATTDAPQEEFITPEAQPSKPDPKTGEKRSGEPPEPKR